MKEREYDMAKEQDWTETFMLIAKDTVERHSKYVREGQYIMAEMMLGLSMDVINRSTLHFVEMMVCQFFGPQVSNKYCSFFTHSITV